MSHRQQYFLEFQTFFFRRQERKSLSLVRIDTLYLWSSVQQALSEELEKNTCMVKENIEMEFSIPRKAQKILDWNFPSQFVYK